ncbi:MAG TPA: hypothetical protein DCL42_07435 [Deltaproteobacteria bacterium]|nr:MAG: hypothetical protein A2067_07285 [Deltaproteobacteria bacterium GWB2_42_7]OGP41263.1 MAG: hypothetical protein A2090_05035 [Deltaproteobacteria bacterium GWD2_42_10]OGQ73923.1 MAG: hypothetical protein A2235_01835 [Deltaproteobacteria bacterium RIFOXYA2_FULL_42_10]HAG51156.1 hypothetical protein [Deltaproteobacteria bacterium]
MNNEHYLKKIFSRYIGSDYTLKSQDLKKENETVCLIAEVLDFANFVEQNSFQYVGVLMNKYYAICAQEIMHNQGSVDNFCGKNVIGLFGLYEQDENAGERACKSGMQIYEALKNELNLGVGICSGRIIYGEFGNDKRATITGFGLPINCANKLAGVDSKINICETIAGLIPEELRRGNAVRVGKHISG